MAVLLETSLGDLAIDLYVDEAPKGAAGVAMVTGVPPWRPCSRPGAGGRQSV